MMRPYGPEMEQFRELELRAAVARARRNRTDRTEPSRSASRGTQALAGALRRVANRLDAAGTSRPVRSAAPDIPGRC
jgi:hypothetical protein